MLVKSFLVQEEAVLYPTLAEPKQKRSMISVLQQRCKTFRSCLRRHVFLRQQLEKFIDFRAFSRSIRINTPMNTLNSGLPTVYGN